MDRSKYRINPAVFERQCGSLHPTKGLGCILLKDHADQHYNEVSNICWPWSGMESGSCGSPNNEFGVGCRKDKGHDGKHQHYEYEWE
jgi:hypothetical protein